MTLDPDRGVRVDSRLKRALKRKSLPKELLVCGPAGTGKTWSILRILHRMAREYANLRILIVRQTRVSLTESVCVTLEQEVFPDDGMEWLSAGASRRNRASYVYPNGSEIVLGGMDNPTRIASTSWDVAFVNEAIELEEDGWETIGSRLDRPGRDRKFGFLIGDTNPGDPSSWLKKRCDEGRTAVWETTHFANRALAKRRVWTQAGRTYLARLERLRGTRRKRLLEGIWAAGEGVWFDTFGDEHISELAEHDPAYPVHFAADSGVHTGAVWFQVKGDGDAATVNVFGDYYAFKRTAYDVAGEMIAATSALGLSGFDYGTTDPAGKASSPLSESTVLSEYQRAGLYLDLWPSYPGSVIEGLSLVESFVAVDPPGLFVHPRCRHTIEAFSNYKRKKRSNQYIDKPEEPQHPYEEILDSIRGGLMSAFPYGRCSPRFTISTAGPPYRPLHGR